MSKKVSVYLADDTLEYLTVIADSQAEEVGLSSAVNLAVQMSSLVTANKVNLSAGELLYCCDILNGGAHLTEFMPPDHVNIIQSLESMTFSLRDGIHEPDILEKWGIGVDVVDKISAMSVPELFALAFATRQFWSPAKISMYKRPGECGDYYKWAEQYIASNKCGKCGYEGPFIDGGETCPECKLVQ